MVTAQLRTLAKGARPREEPRLATLLPREHGSWALVLEPLALALIAAPSWRGAVLALAALALFLMRRPWQVSASAGDRVRADFARRVLVALAATAAGLGATVLVPEAGRLAVPLALAAAAGGIFAWLDLRRGARTAIAECAGAATFAALAAAVILISAGGASVVVAMGVGVFALVRGWTSILPVRVYVRRRKGQAASGAVALVLAGLAAVGFMATADFLGTWVPVAWVVVFAGRTAWLVGPWAPAWPARRIGWMEMVLGLSACVSTGISLQ